MKIEQGMRVRLQNPYCIIWYRGKFTPIPGAEAFVVQVHNGTALLAKRKLGKKTKSSPLAVATACVNINGLVAI